MESKRGWTPACYDSFRNELTKWFRFPAHGLLNALPSYTRYLVAVAFTQVCESRDVDGIFDQMFKIKDMCNITP